MPRGGKRPGAGRPRGAANPDARARRVVVYLEPEVYALAEKASGKGEWPRVEAWAKRVLALAAIGRVSALGDLIEKK